VWHTIQESRICRANWINSRLLQPADIKCLVAKRVKQCDLDTQTLKQLLYAIDDKHLNKLLRYAIKQGMLTMTQLTDLDELLAQTYTATHRDHPPPTPVKFDNGTFYWISHEKGRASSSHHHAYHLRQLLFVASN
jgi:hypothetical protein